VLNSLHQISEMKRRRCGCIPHQEPAFEAA
jgi:hypothetical protein